MMTNFDGSPVYLDKIRRFGVDRGDPEFWQTYEWFQQQFEQSDPIRAGLYDLNRYYPIADGAQEADPRRVGDPSHANAERSPASLR